MPHATAELEDDLALALEAILQEGLTVDTVGAARDALRRHGRERLVQTLAASEAAAGKTTGGA